MYMSIKLRSGKEIYVYDNVIGIDDKLVVYGGYDSRVFERDFDYPLDDAKSLSRDEQIELAEIMITRWQRFKIRAENG